MEDLIVEQHPDYENLNQKRSRTSTLFLEAFQISLASSIVLSSPSVGNQRRDFLYVDDFIKLIFKILNKKKIKSGIYNVGSGKSIRIKTVIEKIRNIIKKGKPLFGKIKMRKEEVINSYPNIVELLKALKPSLNIVE